MAPIVTPGMRASDPTFYDDPVGAWYARDNVFPTDEMRALWEEYYRRVQRVSGKVLDLIRKALGLPDGAWDGVASRPASMLRFQAYPDRGGGIRMGAHTDDSLLTVLHQSVPESGFAALQVELPGEDTWRSVPPSDDVFVCNVGESLAYLTGGRVLATRHRVIAPPEGRAAGSARTSLVHFFHPNWNAPLRPSLPKAAGGSSTKFDNPTLREPDGSVPFYRVQQGPLEALQSDRPQ
jgi:isopenicillin N synthase-like dioxygenase